MKDAHGQLLLVRADGGPTIGFGHVMRSMAIVEEWMARGGRCAWLTTEPSALATIASRWDDLRVVPFDGTSGGSDDARATCELAEKLDAHWVLADLFHFSPAYFSALRNDDVRWMIVSDEPLNVNDRISAILSTGPQAVPEQYSGRDANCGLLFKLDYALIRSDIRTAGAHRNARQNPPRRVLITFGGSDPQDLTWRTLRALSQGLPGSDIRWRVILGPGYRGQCAEDIEDLENLSVELVRGASNMGEHYAWADLVICGANTTLWEALYFGLPAVTIPAAANQQPVFDALADCAAVKRVADPDAEFAQWMAEAMCEVPARFDWAAASAAASQLVDGKGVARVVDYLLSPR